MDDDPDARTSSSATADRVKPSSQVLRTYSRKRKCSGDLTLAASSPSRSSKWADVLESLEPPAQSKKSGRSHPTGMEEQPSLTGDEGKGAGEERAADTHSAPQWSKRRKTVQLHLQLRASPSSSASLASSPLTSRSPATRNPSSSPRRRDSPGGAKLRKRDGQNSSPSAPRSRTARQLYLDLGQERFDWITCPVCEMLYAPGVPADERTHSAFHQHFAKNQQHHSAPTRTP